MNDSVLSGLAGGLIAIGLMGFVSARVHAAPGAGRLRFGWGLALLGACCLVFAALAVAALFVDNDVWVDKGELVAVVSSIVFFCASAIYCLGEYFLVCGTFDEEGIDFTSPWAGRRSEKWNDLESVEFSPWMHCYVLRFNSGRAIRLSTLLSGHGAVLRMLEEDESMPEKEESTGRSPWLH